MERRKGVALTQAQRAHLLTCAAVEDDSMIPLCPLWPLYSRLGLRKGEGLGVGWSDINVHEGVPQSVRMVLLGHASTAMARHYTDHADLAAMREAIGRKVG